MNIYTFAVTATAKTTISVSASNEEDAWDKALDKVDAGDFEVDPKTIEIQGLEDEHVYCPGEENY